MGIDPIRISLVFLKDDEELRIEPDLISAQAIGELLRDRGVKQVVLNACRSAHGSSPETNVGIALLHAGVRTVVAMSYSIVDRAVEVFTKSLYKALFEHKCDLSKAARIARRAMFLNPRRISRFGDPIEMQDSAVPVTYSRRTMQEILATTESDIPTIEVEDADLQARFPFGREGDILNLESALLMGRKPVLLSGPAGIGKTSLLQHLRVWWKWTGFIHDSIVIQLSKERFSTAEDLLIRLQGFFLGTKEYSGPERLIDHLNQKRYLIGLDSLESMPLTSSTTTRKQRAEFKKAVKILQGCQSVVVIASRLKENWLAEHTITHSLRGLHVVSGLERIYSFLLSASQLIRIPALDSGMDKQYFEHIVKLVDGNPLALRLLLQDFLGSFKTPKEYFLDLLGGAPIMINWREAEELEGLRSLEEIHQIAVDLSPKSLGDGFVIHVLAPFWKTLPSAEFPTFINLWNLQNSKQLGKSSRERLNGFQDFVKMVMENNPEMEMTSEFTALYSALSEVANSLGPEEDQPPSNLPGAEELLLLWEDFEPATISLFRELVDVPCKKIIDTLKAASFLQDISPLLIPEELQHKEFLSVHPLLPIVLRSFSFYDNDEMNFRTTITKAYSLFYAYRTKKWPWDRIYFDSTWKNPREELHLEFYNFCGAVQIALQTDDTEGENAALQQAVICRLLTVLPRGALKDLSRIDTVTGLSEKALGTLVEQMGQREAKLRSISPGVEVEDDQLKLISSRIFAMMFALQLMLQCSRLKRNDKVAELFILITNIVDAIKRDGFPELFTHKSVQLHRSLDHNLMIARILAEQDGNMSQETLWELRQNYLKEQSKEPGLEAFAPPEEQRSWQDIPFDILAPLAIQAHNFTAIIQARIAMQSGDLAKARNIIDNALITEIDHGGNDDMNKASLLEIRSEIDAKEGKWEDALRNAEQARTLEESAREGGASLRDGYWERRLKRLTEKAEKLKTVE